MVNELQECVYTPVNHCKGGDICLHWEDLPSERIIYFVRGSEMYVFKLPDLPPEDKSIGTGTDKIEKLLGDPHG